MCRLVAATCQLPPLRKKLLPVRRWPILNIRGDLRTPVVKVRSLVKIQAKDVTACRLSAPPVPRKVSFVKHIPTMIRKAIDMQRGSSTGELERNKWFLNEVWDWFLMERYQRRVVRFDADTEQKAALLCWLALTIARYVLCLSNGDT